MDSFTGMPNFLIVGVSRAGTTSVFDALARHPDVFGSSPKETRYFQPIRYGEPLSPLAEYAKFFRTYAGQAVSMEATPDYLYGGADTATTVHEVCRPRVAVILRDPVTRLSSFFEFMKVRRQVSQTVTLEAYLDGCLELSTSDIDKRAHNAYTGVCGGEYARFLPAWLDRFGENCHVLYYEDLLADPPRVMRSLLGWLDLEPRVDVSPQQLNNSRPSRSHALYVAAATIARHSRPLRQRFPRIEPSARRLYERLNQQAQPTRVDSDSAHAMRRAYEYYEPWNRLLADELAARGLPTDGVTRWVDPAYASPARAVPQT